MSPKLIYNSTWLSDDLWWQCKNNLLLGGHRHKHMAQDMSSRMAQCNKLKKNALFHPWGTSVPFTTSGNFGAVATVWVCLQNLMLSQICIFKQNNDDSYDLIILIQFVSASRIHVSFGPLCLLQIMVVCHCWSRSKMFFISLGPRAKKREREGRANPVLEVKREMFSMAEPFTYMFT